MPHAIRTAAIWAFFGNLLPKLIQPFLLIYIARFLGPADYGLIRMAVIVISFVQLLMGEGFNQALIREKEKIEEAANFTFTFTLICNLILYVAIVLGADQIASFFGEPKAKAVLITMSLGLLIRAFGAVQLALLQRQMNFKGIFHREIAQIVVLVIVTLPMVYGGYGVWALIVGGLASDIAGAAVLWVYSRWKPKFSLAFKGYPHLVNFWKLAIIGNLLVWVILQFDNLLIGKFLSKEDLGVYSLGVYLVITFGGFLLDSINPVIYSKLAMLHNEDTEQVRTFYLEIKKILPYIVFPTVCLLMLTSSHIEIVVYPHKWKGLGFIIVMASIGFGLTNLWAYSGSLFKALGHFQIINKIYFVVSLYLVLVLPLAVHFGLKFFCVVRMSTVIPATLLYNYYESKMLKVDQLYLLKLCWPPLVMSVIMFASGYFFSANVFEHQYSMLSLASITVVASAVYILQLCLFSRQKTGYFLKLLIRSCENGKCK